MSGMYGWRKIEAGYYMSPDETARVVRVAFDGCGESGDKTIHLWEIQEFDQTVREWTIVSVLGCRTMREAIARWEAER